MGNGRELRLVVGAVITKAFRAVPERRSAT